MKVTDQQIIDELATIWLRLKEAREKYHAGDKSRIADSMLQLRKLYLDKGGKSVLKLTQDRFNFTFTVFDFPTLFEEFENDPDFLKETKNSLLHYIHGNHISWLDNGERTKPLLEVLNKKIFITTGTEFSAKDIIEIIADKMGGAHFDENIPDEKLKLFTTIAMFGEVNQTIQLIESMINTSILILDILLNYLLFGVKTVYIKWNLK